MVARLQGHVGGGAFRLGACGFQGHDLGVRPPELPMVSFAHHDTIAHEDAPDQRVGVYVSPALPGQDPGPVQESPIRPRGVGGIDEIVHVQMVRRAARLP